MLRVILDTSSIVSYALTSGEIMQLVIAHWRASHFVLLSSPQTRAELVDLFAGPRIRQRSVISLEPLAQAMARYTWHVPGALTLHGVCRDPKDDKFLACAAEGKAQYLVSSDKDLLTMRLFRDTAIVNPGQFLLALELYAMSPTAMGERFDRDTLKDIQQVVPLESSTANRLIQAIHGDETSTESDN